MNERTADQIATVDRVLRDGTLDAPTVEALLEVLTPGDSSPWPDLRVVLHVAEHAAVRDDLRMHEVPDRLEMAICEALEANLPLLGIRPYGPTYKLAELARTRLDQERRKYEMIVERLDDLEQAAAEAMIGRYLETEPAPMYVNRMRQLHGELFGASEEGLMPTSLREAFGEALVDEALLGGLEGNDGLDDGGQPEERAERLREALDRLVEAVEGANDSIGEARLGEALAAGEAVEQRLAGALMARMQARELVPAAIRRIVQGSPAAPQLAVFAGLTAPERTQSVLSQFLAEVTWQNPELPDAELTDQRVRAILAARAALPMLDSPMPPLNYDELPEALEDPVLARWPERIEGFWALWRCVLKENGSR